MFEFNSFKNVKDYLSTIIESKELSINSVPLFAELDSIWDGSHFEMNKYIKFVCNHLSSKIIDDSDYDTLAAYLYVSLLHKNTANTVTGMLAMITTETGHNIIRPEIQEIYRKWHMNLDCVIDYSLDYKYGYFAIRTLEKMYLLKKIGSNGEDIVCERPQQMLMRVALNIAHHNGLEAVITIYKDLANHYYTMATPVNFNSGTSNLSLASCFLLDLHEDSIRGIYKTVTDCALISKMAGGIGINLQKIRSRGSNIKGTNCKSDGILPLLKVLDTVARHVSQGGRRAGSIACFVKDTEICTVNDGVKAIQDVQVGDMVVTHKNRVRRVDQVHKNPIEDRKIYKLEVNRSKPIFVTGNHKFLSYCTAKTKDLNKTDEWFTIEELKSYMDAEATKMELCYIATPEGTGIEQLETPNVINVADYEHIILDDCECKLDIVNGKAVIYSWDASEGKSNTSKAVNSTWSITEDFANLIGIWLGDGHIRNFAENGYIQGIGFTIHNKNEAEIKYVSDVCEEVFGFKPTLEVKEDNCVDLIVNSYIIGVIFNELFGSEYNNKKLAPMMFGWSLNLVINLIAGLITTDGYISKNEDTCLLGLSNEGLMTQLYHLCRINGLKASFNHEKMYGDMKYDPYVMSIPLTLDILSNTRKYYEDNRVERITRQLVSANVDKAMFTNDRYLKVTSITKVDRCDEFVYTLGVDEDHSYNVGGLIAQNCYIELHHPDIIEFLDAKKPHGVMDDKALALFYGLWVSDLFLKRVEAKGKWSLFDPCECPELLDKWGDEFEEIYVRLENEPNSRVRSVIDASELFVRIIEAQIETGTPYMLAKDTINRLSNQSNVGIIKSSNLCAEIVEVTSPDLISVCNLGSLSTPAFVGSDGKINHELLFDKTKSLVKALNGVINCSTYPCPEANKANTSMRPMGCGLQGLAKAFCMMRVPYTSEEAVHISAEIQETIYYAAIEESCDMAMKLGRWDADCEKDSPMKNGIFQFDGHKNVRFSGRYDWDALKKRVMEHGTYNSLFIAIVPTATTSQLLNNTEACEQLTSNLYVRKVISGEYVVLNQCMVKDLKKLGMWNDETMKSIKANNGSIQHLVGVPQEVKDLYLTTWESPQSWVVKHAIARAPFVDQSQSMNLFFSVPSVQKISSAIFYGWKNGLKTLNYYIRTQPVKSMQSYDIAPPTMVASPTVTSVKVEAMSAAEVCRRDNPEACVMCSG